MIPKYKLKKMMLMAGASAVAMTATSSVTQAQEKALVIDEIIVTATKRNESVQEVPLAMTAFDAAFVKRVNLDDVKDLIKFSPGFAGDSKDSFIDFVNVRGISTNDFGIGGDPSIGFFKNGLYQGRQGTAVSSLYDLDRAEVLRGPQGFLFGRNAISGAISFHTKKPDFDTVSGYIEGGVGQRGIFEAEAAINLPVSENFAIRVAGYTSHENGWISNSFLPNDEKGAGHDKTSGRITAAFKGDDWDATVSAEYEDRKTSGTLYRAVADDDVTPYLQEVFGNSIMPGPDLRSVSNDAGLGNYDTGKVLSLSAEINIDFEFATFTSLTGYKDHDYNYAEDYDGMSLGFNDYDQDQEGNYFEQELRLVSNNEGPLSWYGGVSYYKENIDAVFSSRSDEDAQCGAYYYHVYGTANCAELWVEWEYPEFTPSSVDLLEKNNSRGKYHGWGAYLDLTYAVSDKLDFSAGVRYSKDTKNFAINILPVASELGPWYYYGLTTNGFVDTTRSWDDFTPRFIARYRPNDDMMMYASVTKGFKSGGFGSFGIVLSDLGIDEDLVALPGAVPNHFEPETVWSYEMGIKGSSEDSRVRYDVSAYHYKYTDLQLNYFDSGTIVENIGEVKAYGVEGSLQALLSENFDFILSGSYNSNSIKGAGDIEPDSDGNRLSGTPEFKVAGLLSFHAPVSDTGEVNASVELVAQSSVFIGIGNFEYSQQSGWSDVTFRIGYEDDAGWGISAYAENVFNSIYFDGGYDGAGFQPAVIFGASRPRTFGMKFNYYFGE